jgi:hypothetical protein
VRAAASFALLLVVAAFTGAVPVAAQAADAPDYPIPGGQFFTEALPGRTDGSGFAVFDGHAADLWTAFEGAGGVDVLGYPTSRRFEWDGQVAQAFANGILRFDPATGQTQTFQLGDLPNRKLPAYAVVPDQPPLASGDADPTPWSGWWWPAFDGVGPTLFAPGGPLDKYDQYVQATGAGDPSTRDWERQHLYFPGTPWAGHCNGFAAAALLEPEPTAPVTVLGITFAVADLKGLLVDYHFGDAAEWSYGQDSDLDPADLQRMLLTWMGQKGHGFVLTYDLGGGEVWSYPVYRFDSQWRADPAVVGLWHVTTTLWMADMDVSASFIGTQAYPSQTGKVLTYDLTGDPRQPDAGGSWTGASTSGRFAHPARIWYPKAEVRNPVGNLTSPGLDRQTLANILAGKTGA